MKLHTILLPWLALALPLLAQDKDGFTPLSGGKTTAGWTNPYQWGKIEVVNGEFHLTADKKFFPG